MVTVITHESITAEPGRALGPSDDGALPVIPSSAEITDTTQAAVERSVPLFRPRFLPPPDGMEWS